MTVQPIRFDDGAAYERGMGQWSRPAGEIFLDWLAPPPAARWVDVGCGSGAFTALLAERSAPADLQGIDPSDAQLAFARTRPGVSAARFQQGDAMALPFPDDRFDAAVMALVIFFVPDPPKGVAEMARVVRPGGLVAAYAWDMASGGFPFAPIQAELRDAGIAPPMPPSVSASRMDELLGLWRGAGLEALDTRVIEVQRTFADFEDYWSQSTVMGASRQSLTAMAPADAAALKDRVRARLATDGSGRVTHTARANAIKGRLPG
jgi:SAM-dependent methyltransferase